MFNLIQEAKIALKKEPKINEDLYDIDLYYRSCSGEFFLAIDEKDSVVGMIGYRIENNKCLLHRFYIKPAMKRNGIGTMIYNVCEEYIKQKGINEIYVHLGTPKEDWIASYNFYQKMGFIFIDENHIKKILK